MNSPEEQLWSCKVSGCSVKDMPVFFLYAVKEDSKIAWKRTHLDWSPIILVGKKCSLEKGVVRKVRQRGKGA